MTLANNSSRDADFGYALRSEHVQIGIRNSIIANNTGDACRADTGFSEITASLVDGFEFCGTPTLTSDPALGSLTGNYFPLLDTSPAIGAGNATYCAQLPTDQIGNARPQADWQQL